MKRLLELLGLKRPEVFCDQPVIERYNDYKEIGTWAHGAINEDGSVTIEEQGKMLSRTVKFIGKDGTTKLGKEWIEDRSVII